MNDEWDEPQTSRGPVVPVGEEPPYVAGLGAVPVPLPWDDASSLLQWYRDHLWTGQRNGGHDAIDWRGTGVHLFLGSSTAHRCVRCERGAYDADGGHPSDERTLRQALFVELEYRVTRERALWERIDTLEARLAGEPG